MNNSILLLGAMDVETSLFIKSLKNFKEELVADYHFYSGTIGEKKVIVGRTNVGMENAAAVTAIAMVKFNPDIVISQGTAGAHNKLLHKNDIVVAERLLNLAAFQSKRIPEGGGIHPEEWNLLDLEIYDNENCESTVELHSDSELLSKAMSVDYEWGKVIKGTVGSSDNWNMELDRIIMLNEKFGTDCEEMESWSTALICHHFNKRFFAARVISNSEHYADEEYERETGEKCQKFILSLIEKL